MELEHQVWKLNEEVKTLTEKCQEQERYKRRWNLCVKCLKEKEQEDTLFSLLSKIAPGVSWNIDDMVDTVHRVGKKDHNRTRQVIIQFVKQECRNEIWKLSKDCDVCKQAGIRFAEDLAKEDKATREKLWPKIKEARDQKKRAYFRGPYGFIENVQIFA